MLVMMVTEAMVLVEVIFWDRPASGIQPHFGGVEIYFALVIATVLLQAAGILLVRQSRYRAGGAMQIAASALHLLKIEGLIGIIGGLRAWKRGEPEGAGDSTPA
jgi:hypothetical protein